MNFRLTHFIFSVFEKIKKDKYFKTIPSFSRLYIDSGVVSGIDLFG